MLARIQKWGNSLGLRIPKALAEDANVAEGSDVELNVENGSIIVTAQRKMRYRVKDLVAGITPENMHGEIDTGPPVGREVW
jgi:antitoxin MazE